MNIEGTVKQEIHNLSRQLSIKTGNRVAIAVDSRGIAEIELIVKTIAFELKKLGAKPFIVNTRDQNMNQLLPLRHLFLMKMWMQLCTVPICAMNMESILCLLVLV